MNYNWHELEEARLESDDFYLEKFHEMFFNIKKRVENEDSITLAESYSFCTSIWIAQQNSRINEKVWDYKVCEDYWFMYLASHYWFNLDGLYPEINPYTSTEYSFKEKEQFINYLFTKCDEWYDIINVTNHRNQCLQEISKETRREIKSYKKQPEWNEYGFLRECNYYDRGLKLILLRSRYIFLKVETYFDKIGSESQVLYLCNREIHLTPASLIHIINRHYEMSRKQVEREKSFHLQDIEIVRIHEVIQRLFHLIDDNLSEKIDQRYIHFKFKCESYSIWFKTKTFYKKNVGRLDLLCISTFYRIGAEMELNKVVQSCHLIILDSEYSLYLLS